MTTKTWIVFIEDTVCKNMYVYVCKSTNGLYAINTVNKRAYATRWNKKKDAEKIAKAYRKVLKTFGENKNVGVKARVNPFGK